MPKTLSLIAKTLDSTVAHVTFSPVLIENNENCQAYILAPLAVDYGHQKQNIGTTLVEYGMKN